MKSFLKCLCLYMVFLLPLTTQAKPTDQIIFRNPDSKTELWLTDIWDARNTHRIFKHTHGIWEFAVQKDGPYVVFIAGHDGEIVENDVYLIDRNQSDEKARNLTQKQFEEVWDLDISINGDIIFTNVPTGENPLAKTGLFLIPNSEIKKQVPKIKLLKEKIEARELVWAPDGDQIAYSTSDGIFTLDIATRRIAHINKFGWYLAFSPDGKKLAFAKTSSVHVISLEIPHGQKKIIPLRGSVSFGGLKWSSDGEYIFYATSKNNFAAPINGGAHVEIFEQFESGVWFDWVHSKGYPVGPTDRLTTLWGKLKQ